MNVCTLPCLREQALPADFQTTMEEYIRDAPKGVEPGSGSASASQNPAAAGEAGSGLRLGLGR